MMRPPLVKKIPKPDDVWNKGKPLFWGAKYSIFRGIGLIKRVVALFPIEISELGDGSVDCKYPIMLISLKGKGRISPLILLTNLAVFGGLFWENEQFYKGVRGPSGE
jgi:hypothetical protein